MNKTISKINHGFENTSGKTPEFTAFCRTFKLEFKKLLNTLGCVDLECFNGHFYISGFFNSAYGQLWYFSLGDVRLMKRPIMLVRTAQHRKDYTGGTNMWVNLDELAENLTRIIKP